MEATNNKPVSRLEFYSLISSVFSFFTIAFVATLVEVPWLAAIGAFTSLGVQVIYTRMLLRERRALRSSDEVPVQ
ncbi:MAG: hypothetical protein WD534_18000 [Phycisphaeraceae bacterium]